MGSLSRAVRSALSGPTSCGWQKHLTSLSLNPTWEVTLENTLIPHRIISASKNSRWKLCSIWIRRRVDNVVDTSAQERVDLLCRAPWAEPLNRCASTFNTAIAFHSDLLHKCIQGSGWMLTSLVWVFACQRMLNVTKMVFVDGVWICSLYCFSFALFQANSCLYGIIIQKVIIMEIRWDVWKQRV